MFYKSTKQGFRIWSIAGVLLAMLFAVQAQASVFLGPGGFVWLPGTTSAAEPDLAGVVQHDEGIDFEIRSAAGDLLFEGRLQSRVVRSNSTNLLHFSYKIKDTTAGLPGQVIRIEAMSYAGWDTHVDYRADGPAGVAAIAASRSPWPGEIVRFHFGSQGIAAGQNSRSCLIKTYALNWDFGGMTRIVLASGESVILDNTLMPVD